MSIALINILKKVAHPQISLRHKNNLIHQVAFPDSVFSTQNSNDLLYKHIAENTLDSIMNAIFCTNIYGNIIYMNVAAENLTGWMSIEAIGRPCSDVFKILNSVNKDSLENPVYQVLKTNKPLLLNSERILVTRNGKELFIEDSVSPIHDKDGYITGAVVVFHDVSSEKAKFAKMMHFAQHDYLTNLPNRILLNDRITQAISLASRHDNQVALLYLDLDNFKFINDSLGHDTGDKLLQSVSKRLINSVRTADTVSRHGGDEFIILLADIKNHLHVALTAEKILNDFIQPHVINNIELSVTTSIGISIYPKNGIDPETLIKRADIAMYSAKEQGPNRYQFFIDEESL